MKTIEEFIEMFKKDKVGNFWTTAVVGIMFLMLCWMLVRSV